MKELEVLGPRLTWINKRSGKGRIWEKLDRFVANEAWLQLFPVAKASNLGFYGSDHMAIKVQLNFACETTVNMDQKRFFSENKWMMEEGFSQAVKDAWTRRIRPLLYR
ncbi:hypothetical protein ACS0TY_007839 [Phlomoides rotata]